MHETAKQRVMRERKERRMQQMDGFDVVCTIGRVVFGDGEQSPRTVAFGLIAEHGAEGTFTFPNEDGTVCRVTVEHTA